MEELIRPTALPEVNFLVVLPIHEPEPDQGPPIRSCECWNLLATPSDPEVHVRWLFKCQPELADLVHASRHLVSAPALGVLITSVDLVCKAFVLVYRNIPTVTAEDIAQARDVVDRHHSNHANDPTRECPVRQSALLDFVTLILHSYSAEVGLQEQERDQLEITCTLVLESLDQAVRRGKCEQRQC